MGQVVGISLDVLGQFSSHNGRLGLLFLFVGALDSRVRTVAHVRTLSPTTMHDGHCIAALPTACAIAGLGRDRGDRLHLVLGGCCLSLCEPAGTTACLPAGRIVY